MEGGGRAPLLTRLFSKLRGDLRAGNVKRKTSYSATMYPVSVQREASEAPSAMASATGSCCSTGSNLHSDANNSTDYNLSAGIDLRYGGQCLAPEQLPEFCDQLHNLVEVIRNIQTYAHITGEYPSELEKRLEQEAREVAALAAEARNARDVIVRAKLQRKAVRAYKKHVMSHLTHLKETEVRELENTVRLSDRKLFKSWETVKDTSDVKSFDSLLDEIKSKQTALECLLRLIDHKRSALSKQATTTLPTPLPPPEPRDNDVLSTATGASRKRLDTRRPGARKRRKEPRSVPLSEESSRHATPLPQVTLYIQGADNCSRYRAGSTGAVALAPLELPSGGSVRDILFFTAT